MKKLQLKYSTPKIKLNSVKKLCENKDNSSNIKNCATVAMFTTAFLLQTIEKGGIGTAVTKVATMPLRSV